MKLKIFLIVCIMVILSGISFNQLSDSTNLVNCIKTQNSQINLQITDNGFNPNKKKKC